MRESTKNKIAMVAVFSIFLFADFIASTGSDYINYILNF